MILFLIVLALIITIILYIGLGFDSTVANIEKMNDNIRNGKGNRYE